MEYEGKKTNPYRGCWIIYLLMTVIPVILYIPFYIVFDKFQNFPNEISIWTAIAFSCLIGTIFNISCIIAGIIGDLVSKLFSRLGEFFGNVRLMGKRAFELYNEDFKEDGGILLWIFLTVAGAILALSIIGFCKFIGWYI